MSKDYLIFLIFVSFVILLEIDVLTIHICATDDVMYNIIDVTIPKEVWDKFDNQYMLQPMHFLLALEILPAFEIFVLFKHLYRWQLLWQPKFYKGNDVLTQNPKQ